MKTEELTGQQLDYWVAKASDMPVYECGTDSWPGNSKVNAERFERPIITVGLNGAVCIETAEGAKAYEPSADWSQAGPIIEQQAIQLSPPTTRVHRNGGPHAGWDQSGIWTSCTWHAGVNGKRSFGFHETSPLIAAMRCYVRHMLGEEVPQ